MTIILTPFQIYLYHFFNYIKIDEIDFNLKMEKIDSKMSSKIKELCADFVLSHKKAGKKIYITLFRI